MTHHDYGNKTCTKCEGKGFLIAPTYTETRGAYWFEKGSFLCRNCNGKGEE